MHKDTTENASNILACGPGELSRYSDSLRAGRSRDRISVEARFSAGIQTGPGANPASSTMATGSFMGVKRPGRDVNEPPKSSGEVKERLELYLCSPSRPSQPVLGRTWYFCFPTAGENTFRNGTYKVVQIWPGQTVSCLHTISPGHIWTTLYINQTQTQRNTRGWRVDYWLYRVWTETAKGEERIYQEKSVRELNEFE